MNIIKTKTFNASITLGLEVGYTNVPINKEQLLVELQAYQQRRTDEANIYLSALITECNIVLNCQNEPHLKLEFINYPKFPMRVEVFKSEILNLAAYLLTKMKQNRTVIVFTDETVMLELSEEIDPRI